MKIPQLVDVVLEDGRGRIVAVEIKAAASAGRKDFQGIERFAETARDRFTRGVVLCAGNNAVTFDERLHALPISSIWR
jgi:predicted AAA+ superfamily ATPase